MEGKTRVKWDKRKEHKKHGMEGKKCLKQLQTLIHRRKGRALKWTDETMEKRMKGKGNGTEKTAQSVRM